MLVVVLVVPGRPSNRPEPNGPGYPCSKGLPMSPLAPIVRLLPGRTVPGRRTVLGRAVVDRLRRVRRHRRLRARWAGLLLTIVVMLTVDLMLHRGHREPTPGRALVESLVWVVRTVVRGRRVGSLGWSPAGEYFSGYLIEKSLSVDNVFVWAVIFSTFAIPLRYQHRVLFWGVFGALVLRAVHRRRRRTHLAVLVAPARVRVVPRLHGVQGPPSSHR